MGSNKMKNSLMLMAYPSSNGDNVTLSPRLSYDNVEPSYTSNVTMHILPGTGVSNQTIIVNAHCQNCRSWKGGSLNITSTAQNFIYAAGPDGTLKSNSLSAGIKRHSMYGTFTMDLTKAVGIGGVPVIPLNNTAGTTQTSDTDDHDFPGAFHAVLMVGTFVGLMPLGVMLLRIFNSGKWHGINQAFSAGVALIGVFLGIYAGTMFNRVGLLERTY